MRTAFAQYTGISYSPYIAAFSVTTPEGKPSHQIWPHRSVDDAKHNSQENIDENIHRIKSHIADNNGANYSLPENHRVYCRQQLLQHISGRV